MESFPSYSWLVRGRLGLEPLLRAELERTRPPSLNLGPDWMLALLSIPILTVVAVISFVTMIVLIVALTMFKPKK